MSKLVVIIFTLDRYRNNNIATMEFNLHVNNVHKDILTKSIQSERKNDSGIYLFNCADNNY